MGFAVLILVVLVAVLAFFVLRLRHSKRKGATQCYANTKATKIAKKLADDMKEILNDKDESTPISTESFKDLQKSVKLLISALECK